MLKERTYKENHAEIFLSEPRKGENKLKERSQPMASRKRFQNDRTLKRENGTETLLCDVIVVLNIATFETSECVYFILNEHIGLK